MGNWAPEGFGKSHNRISSLREACLNLTPKAKQAMYAAAKRGPIAQRTWDGCAFNAAGTEIQYEDNVGDYHTAARAFDMTVADVRAWISFWDRYASPDPTADLVNTLDSVGLFSSPEGKGFAGKTFVKVVHESEQTKFERLVADLDLDAAVSEEDAEFKRGVASAAELIFA